MEFTITPKTVGNLCRVCLTTSKNLTLLVNEKILEMLEVVTFNKIIVDDTKFPSKICQMCLSFLKISYEFQIQFKNSQTFLEKATNDKPIEKREQNKVDVCGAPKAPPVAVELIYGKNKFDLRDVVVVEDEKTDTFSFEGFLKNLGSEVSARFLTQSHTTPCKNVEEISVPEFENNPQPEESITQFKKRKKKPKLCYKNLDFSRLKVRKCSETCRVVIEDEDTHVVVKTLFECPTCQKILPTSHDLQQHKSLKHPSSLVCEKCGQVVQTQSQLYHHMQKHKGKRFQCCHCEKKYDTVSRLRFHLEKHKNERRFLCSVCGKNFNYQVSLKYHMRIHAEKSLVCNICGLMFRMPNTLKRHMRTHTKDRPYSCDYCSKRFPSRGEQLSHEMLHTGLRPYRCEFCGKGFTKGDNLKTHYLSHPGSIGCNLCPKSFLEMDFLKLHMKRAHKNESDDEKEECTDFYI